MSKKKTFALRIDDSVYSSVEQWAADEFRSVNGQLEWMIREQLKKAGRLRKESDSKGGDRGENRIRSENLIDDIPTELS